MIQALKYLRCHQPTPSTVMAAPAVTNTASSFVRCLSIAYLVYVLKYKYYKYLALKVGQLQYLVGSMVASESEGEMAAGENHHGHGLADQPVRNGG
jgi:hypothetical protein